MMNPLLSATTGSPPIPLVSERDGEGDIETAGREGSAFGGRRTSLGLALLVSLPLKEDERETILPLLRHDNVGLFQVPFSWKEVGVQGKDPSQLCCCS